jgi:hypothetical protein
MKTARLFYLLNTGKTAAAHFNLFRVKMTDCGYVGKLFYLGRPLGQREDGKCFISIGAGGE